MLKTSEEKKESAECMDSCKGLNAEFIKKTRLINQTVEMIKGHEIKQSLLEIDMDSNGVVLPRIMKHIICHPPAPIKLVQEVAGLKESLGGLDEPVLSQLFRDARFFESLDFPINLIKYENE